MYLRFQKSFSKDIHFPQVFLKTTQAYTKLQPNPN